MEPLGHVPSSHVPVSLGSERAWSVEIDGFRVTEAWFPPHLRLDRHRHDRASLAIMLEGSFDLFRTRRTEACPPASVFTEPATETHANRVERAGAHVVILQPDERGRAIAAACGALFEEATHLRHAGISGLAWRIAHELRVPDAVSPLVIEGTALEIVAETARVHRAPFRSRPLPSWLPRLRDLLHARYLETLTTGGLARDMGVHPVHLARVFRAHHGMTVGAYVRGLRLDWAARRLIASREPLCDIALAAGFADQSHFTRAFRRHVGTTPDRFRRALGHGR